MPNIDHSPAGRRTRQFAALAEVARVIACDAPLGQYDFGDRIGPVVALAYDLDTPLEMGCQDNIASVNRNIDDETGGPMNVVARQLLYLAYIVLNVDASSEEDLDSNDDDYIPWNVLNQNAIRSLESEINNVRRFTPHDKELLNAALRRCVITRIDTDGPNAPVYDLTRRSESMESHAHREGVYVEPTAGGSAAQEAKNADPLGENELIILQLLHSSRPKLLKGCNIESITALAHETVGKCLQTLSRLHLVIRPRGPRKGNSITKNGIALLERFNANQTLTSSSVHSSNAS